MNRYPLWKNLLLVVTLLIGTLYALPNLYGEAPAIQISSALRDTKVDPGLQTQLETFLKEQKLTFLDMTIEQGSLLIRFPDSETQLHAVDKIREHLGNQYVTALNLAPQTPKWLTQIGALPMYLGLDLRGGVHFLMEVDTVAAISKAEDRYVEEIKALLRKNKIRYAGVAAEKSSQGIKVALRSPNDQQQATQLIKNEFLELTVTEEADKPTLIARLQESALENIRKLALEQNITTLRNRVNELGVSEPIVQQQGKTRIVVQLPGVQDTVRAKEILGATATIEFRMVDGKNDVQEAARSNMAPPGSRLYRDRRGQPILLDSEVLLTGDYVTNAVSGIEQTMGSPAVFITLDNKGARIFSQETKTRVGQMMSVVFIETKSESRWVDGKEVRSKRKVEEVINMATIREQLGQRFQITGLDTPGEARDLALLLRAGALAAPMDIIEERTIGPSLGKDNINQGLNSVLGGFLAVAIFIAFYYRLFGVVAVTALFMNLVLLIALLSILQATMTLPGIAGIVLTLGMAVDANVLINERIREELRNGTTPQAAIHAGYERAFATIADSNITTLIAALSLFLFGTGPVKGFAVVLSLGILTSMFSAILGSRAIINLIYGKRKVAALSI